MKNVMTKKSLAFSKETLRMLDTHDLRRAGGGGDSGGCSILSEICPTTDGGWGSSLCVKTKPIIKR